MICTKVQLCMNCQHAHTHESVHQAKHAERSTYGGVTRMVPARIMLIEAAAFRLAPESAVARVRDETSSMSSDMVSSTRQGDNH